MDNEKLQPGEPKGHEAGSMFGSPKDGRDVAAIGRGGAKAGSATPSSTTSGSAEPQAAEPYAAERPDAMPSLPVAEPFRGFTSGLPKERTGVFGQLVGDDGDITGLVAYSIYKQNKLDWLSAFETAKGRDPTEDELASYIIGEGTPRRLATYRHLAEATLAGSGPTVHGAGQGPGPRIGPRRTIALGENPGLIATYVVIALLFLIGLLLAAHYTMSAR